VVASRANRPASWESCDLHVRFDCSVQPSPSRRYGCRCPMFTSRMTTRALRPARSTPATRVRLSQIQSGTNTPTTVVSPPRRTFRVTTTITSIPHAPHWHSKPALRVARPTTTNSLRPIRSADWPYTNSFDPVGRNVTWPLRESSQASPHPVRLQSSADRPR